MAEEDLHPGRITPAPALLTSMLGCPFLLEELHSQQPYQADNAEQQRSTSNRGTWEPIGETGWLALQQEGFVEEMG